MTIPELTKKSDGGVLVLTLNRPERRNALSIGLRKVMSEALLDADDDDTVRAVVITGAGDKAFCAGADIKEMADNDDSGKKFRGPMSGPDRSVFEVILDMKTPTIAALNGSAVAGGFELALACDMRIAHPGVQFGMPEAKIGMGANFASVILPRRIAPAIALEILLTGDYFDAEQALRIGLINRVVPAERVLAESMELAAKIAANAPLSVRRMKAMALRSLDMAAAAALRLELGPSPYLSEDRKEGIKARLEKRKPNWRGK